MQCKRGKRGNPPSRPTVCRFCQTARIDRRRRPGRVRTGACRACFDSLDLLTREELRRHGRNGVASDERVELRRQSSEAFKAHRQTVAVPVAVLDALLNATTPEPKA